MSVGYTCPSMRAQDPLAVQNGEKPGLCPGHKGSCRVMHTPRQELRVKDLDQDQLLQLAKRFNINTEGEDA